MPPLLSQDPTEALRLALHSRWLEAALTLASVACEPWVVGLLALAVYSWLEREVLDVLRAAAPLLVALAAGAAAVALAQRAGLAPRPASAGVGAWAALRRFVPGEPTVAVATFVVYSLRVYGRRALGVLALAAVAGLARVWAGPHWLADLVAGGAAGAVLASLAHGAAVRLFPEGHLAALRAARRGAAEGPASPAEPPLP